MKKRNILLVLLMTVSVVVHAHGDKQKDKGMLKGLDTPATKVVLALHAALEPIQDAAVSLNKLLTQDYI